MPDDLQDSQFAQLTEETTASERPFSGSRFSVRVDRIRMADGRESIREVAEHPDAVVVLALREDGAIPFVRQWRVPAGRPLLELPAGRVDPGETPLEAARRELREEVGLDPTVLQPALEFFVAPGWATEYLYGYIARDCVEAPLPPDSDEELIVEWLTLGEAMTRVEDGEIVDAKSLILLQALALEAVGPLARKVIRYYAG